MHPDNIDDLFRQQLDGHATPPAPDLWARLQLPAADTDPVDAVFQDGLRGHATPPRRELWQRLEDEHLRPQPRRRRAVAWWQLSAAAVLLLFLAAGGLLWRGSYVGGAGNGVAQQPTDKTPNSTGRPTNAIVERPSVRQPQLAAQPQNVAATNSLATATQKKNQENSSTQATAPQASTSSTPIATTTRPRRAATTHRASGGHQPSSLPDAATSALARNGGRHTPHGQSTTTSSQALNSVLTPTTHSNVAPALAVATPPVAPATTPEIIEVEVRRGNARPTPPPAAVVAVADDTPAPTRRRGLRLGGLLRQADHLVHGEPMSLAEATGLPENVTVQAHLGGRLISKTIQL